MWRQAAQQTYPDVAFRDPASEDQLIEAERRLGREIPTELKQLLLESNGVLGQTSIGTVWSIDQVIDRNLSFWSNPSFAELYMPFESFLFFGDNGGGDHFALVQRPPRPDVFVWEHENDSRRWVANDLLDYLQRSLRDGGDDWYQL